MNPLAFPCLFCIPGTEIPRIAGNKPFQIKARHIYKRKVS